MINLMKPVRADVMVAEYVFRMLDADTDDEILRNCCKFHRLKHGIRGHGELASALCTVLSRGNDGMNCLTDAEFKMWMDRTASAAKTYCRRYKE